MTKLVICGQAPSRVGDGRAFSGPSGRRLASLMLLPDYEALARQVILTNIFDAPAARRAIRCRPSSKRNAPGDEFNMDEAYVSGMTKMLEWAADPELVVVLACGKNVTKALGFPDLEFYKGRALKAGPVQGVDVWAFPHPSGASQYWNDQANHVRASIFLKRLLKRYEIRLIE